MNRFSCFFLYFCIACCQSVANAHARHSRSYCGSQNALLHPHNIFFCLTAISFSKTILKTMFFFVASLSIILSLFVDCCLDVRSPKTVRIMIIARLCFSLRIFVTFCFFLNIMNRMHKLFVAFLL